MDEAPKTVVQLRPDKSVDVERVVLSAPFPERELAHRHFRDIGAKGLTFEGYDFSACVFERAYFHRAKFIRCRFVGARFSDCNFREATFIGCDFTYSIFRDTIVPTDEFLSNLPSWPNARRELMRLMRVNAASVGDYRSEKIFIREEMAAAREHLRQAREKRDGYYVRHYPGPINWIKIRVESIALWFDWILWGHGEHVGRAFLTLGGFLALVAFCQAIAATPHLADQTIGGFANGYLSALDYVCRTFLDIPTNEYADNVTFAYILVISRYFSMALLFAALYRRLSNR